MYNLAMTENASDILKKALTLPAAERADLAGSLIESLDEAEDGAVEAAWEAEIVRRMEELDSGKVKPIPLGEVRRRLSSAIE
jgi:putative addiction module component (TIGR02574 family)